MKYFVMLFVLALIIGCIKLLPASTSYWENVGPQWDQMLNPNKYEE